MMMSKQDNQHYDLPVGKAIEVVQSRSQRRMICNFGCHCRQGGVRSAVRKLR